MALKRKMAELDERLEMKSKVDIDQTPIIKDKTGIPSSSSPAFMPKTRFKHKPLPRRDKLPVR